MKKDEIYMTYLLLSPTKGMSGLVDNNESPIKFIKKGLSLVYPSENVGIRLDNTDKGSEIIYNYLKQGSEEIVRSIDEFYINGIVYYHRNERIKQRELRKSMKL